MQSLSDAVDFRSFYRENAQIYTNCISLYTDTADVTEMKRWLDERFPDSSDYDLYRVVFSPLVSYNQSSTWFESNGFRELQPHVNFPYEKDAKRYGKMSKLAETIYRGNIVFTEINHGYMNIVAHKLRAEISDATSNRDKWVSKEKGPNYYAGNSAFNEYMNWALVSLRIMDYVLEAEQEQLIQRVERSLSGNRGFLQFKPFNRFLMDLYLNRGSRNSTADLYPAIVAWFADNN